MSELFIGCLIGGTNMEFGYELDGTFVSWDSIPTPQLSHSEGVLDMVRIVAENIQDHLGWDALGLGVAFCGPVNGKDGIVYEMPNVSGWKNPVEAEGLLRNLTGRRVVIDNDTNAEGLAEWRWGVGKAIANPFIYTTVGTGVGAGIIINREPFRGHRGTAGEVGHFYHDAGFIGEIPQCGCGRYHHAEARMSANGIGHYAARFAKTNHNLRSWLANRNLNPQDMNAELLAIAAAEGLPVAVTLVEAARKEIAKLMVSMMAAYDPEMIALGGGLFNSPIYFDGLEGQTKDYAMKAFDHVQLRLGTVDHRGVRGAIALVKA